ncbi:NPCBM/NEW2 domain-containing protein [Streptomyces mayteni]
MAALITAVTGLVGLLLGFLGLPTVIDSPTATAVTVTETIRSTATVTVTASPDADSGSGEDTGSGEEEEPAPLPPGEVALADLEEVGNYPSYELGSATMGGVRYEDAMLIAYSCNEDMDYSINERYTTLTLIFGLDDNTIATPASITISGDGQQLESVGAEINRPREVTVDVTGVARLLITTELAGDSCPDTQLAIGNAVLHD